MIRYLLISLIFTLNLSTTFAQLSSDEQKVIDDLDKQSDHYFSIAQKIWDLAEVGYQEEKSAHLLQETLRKSGFDIETGVADIPTAFVATYGQGSPVIGILGEYDALPGITQTNSPIREKREDVDAGHACGHHLFGSGSTAAAIAIKEWMKSNKINGTIRFYGTPAEEGGAGKVYLVRAGLFDDVNAVLHWHPSNGNSADAASSLANKSAKFRYYGQSSHAAGSPWNGRSALDGVEAMNFMVNMMREHMTAESRTHYVITKGGNAPNVIPDFAEVFYYVRHPDIKLAAENFERVVQCAEGAAQGSGTKMEYEIIHGIYNVLPNVTLSQIMHDKLSMIGGVKYDKEEKAFAEKIINTFPYADNVSVNLSENVNPFKVIRKGQGGSTDVGDVSWVVPTAGMRAATWVPGTSAHSWQAIAAGGTSIGKKGMMIAAKTISLTALHLFQNPEIMDEAKSELYKQRGKDFIYKPLLGDREPPLDYRK